MLVPSNCVVLLVASDAVINDSSALVLNARRLFDGAKILNVPTIFGRFPADADGSELFSHSISNSSMSSLPFHPKPEAWAATEFGQAIAATSRNQVIIAGFWLEEAVTLLALNCLAVGYDTYLAGDATPAVDGALEAAARARLAQAGVVPTSIDQVIREWAALHDDPAHAGKLIAGLPQRAQSSP